MIDDDPLRQPSFHPQWLPNTNSAYPGYDATGPCVDVGAVQTNYALSFSGNPPSTGTIPAAMSPAPQVTLTESGSVFTANAASISGGSNPPPATTYGIPTQPSAGCQPTLRPDLLRCFGD